MGNLTGSLPGVWNDFCLVGAGKIAPKCEVSVFFFFFLFRAAKSVKAINTFLDER